MKLYLFILIFPFVLFSCKPEQKNDCIEAPCSKVENWARPGALGQMSGAYFVYSNTLSIADTLLKADSPQAKMTQIHESYITEDGLSGMREMKDLVIQPNEDLVLEQGGLHVMLMNLTKDLSSTDSVSVKLTFAQAGIVEMKLPVRSSN